jgi:YHS domain-containing protein
MSIDLGVPGFKRKDLSSGCCEYRYSNARNNIVAQCLPHLLASHDQEVTMQAVLDPVCGMTVDPETAAGHSKFEGRDYYFCSVACKTTFDHNPGNYSHADRGTSAASGVDDPPYTKTGPIVAPKFGAAGSGGGEYEPLPGEKRHTKG